MSAENMKQRLVQEIFSILQEKDDIPFEQFYNGVMLNRQPMTVPGYIINEVNDSIASTGFRLSKDIDGFIFLQYLEDRKC